jgi:hypothetical protein
MRCFGGRDEGFYIIGSAIRSTQHVLRLLSPGWNGVTVEPNRLARLTMAVRPRDRHLETPSAGRGRNTFYVVNDFHGPSTMIEDHAARRKVNLEGFERHCRPGDDAQGVVRAARTAPHSTFKVDVEGRTDAAA